MKRYLVFILVCIGLLLSSGIASAKEMEQVIINSSDAPYTSAYVVKYKEDRKGGQKGFKLKVYYYGEKYDGGYTYDDSGAGSTASRTSRSLGRAKRYSYDTFARAQRSQQNTFDRLGREAFKTYKQFSRDDARNNNRGYNWIRP